MYAGRQGKGRQASHKGQVRANKYKARCKGHGGGTVAANKKAKARARQGRHGVNACVKGACVGKCVARGKGQRVWGKINVKQQRVTSVCGNSKQTNAGAGCVWGCGEAGGAVQQGVRKGEEILQRRQTAGAHQKGKGRRW